MGKLGLNILFATVEDSFEFLDLLINIKATNHFHNNMKYFNDIYTELFKYRRNE